MDVQRQLGFWETVRQNTHLNKFGTAQIAVTAKVSGPLTASLLKQSFRLLFEQQPLLQARIEKRENNYFFVIDRQFEEIPFIIIQRTSSVLWTKNHRT